ADRGDVPRAQEPARAVRGRCGLDAGSRRGDARAPPPRARRARRRLRPAPGDAAGDPRPRPRLQHRPAAVPAGLPARAAAVLAPLQRRPRRARGHEHGPELRHPRHGRPLPDDAQPLRGELEPGALPGRAQAPHLNYSPRRVGLARCSVRDEEEATSVRKLSRKWVAILGVLALVAAGATASTKKKTANVDVCVLLPDTKSSVRWVQFDAPDLKKAFAKAGVKASINNALND